MMVPHLNGRDPVLVATPKEMQLSQGHPPDRTLLHSAPSSLMGVHMLWFSQLRHGVPARVLRTITQVLQERGLLLCGGVTRMVPIDPFKQVLPLLLVQLLVPRLPQLSIVSLCEELTAATMEAMFHHNVRRRQVPTVTPEAQLKSDQQVLNQMQLEIRKYLSGKPTSNNLQKGRDVLLTLLPFSL
jgi:hypothetical protein